MAETNRNEWVKNFESSINGASPQNSVDNNGDSSATVDKYDNLKNISYKEIKRKGFTKHRHPPYLYQIPD